MRENSYLSIKNLNACRPQQQIAQFAHATPLCYVGNFWPQKLGPLPLEKFLDPHLSIGAMGQFWVSQVVSGKGLPVVTQN